jgi:serine/threonine protein kinase
MVDGPSGGDSLTGAPELFGTYAIQSLIGRGSFSSVFRAQLQGQYGFRKQVGLKVLRHRLKNADEKVSADFLNEARLGASIRHPNLVEFYECGRVGDRLYIAMELVDGPDLGQLLQMVPDPLPPLSDELVITLAMQLARGLKALHLATHDGKPIQAIHRDFKPGNILLSPHGLAKITDYGIVRFAADFYEPDQTEGLRGSPLYMSPEQARGEPLTQASDIFSFGVTVLEMITGAPVFREDTVSRIVDRVQHADAGAALLIARAQFPQLVAVLEDCLLPDPASRIPHGGALVEALKDIDPPPFGEELITDMAVETYGFLEIQQASMWNRPVSKFWATLVDDEEESVSIQLVGFGGAQEDRVTDLEQVLAAADAAEDARVDAEESASETTTAAAAATADASQVDRRRPRALLPWIVTGVAVVAVLILLVLPRFRTSPGDGEEPTPAAETRTDEPTPPADADAAVAPSEGETAAEPTVELVEPPPADPTVEPITPPPADPPVDVLTDGSPPAADAEPATEVVETPADPAAGQGPPRLNHTPVARGIRGKDIRFTVGVDPAGSYRSTVWFRGVPAGSWQTRKIDGGGDGTLTVVIPAGVWLDQTATEVEYFIEVAGPGGLARSGSAVDPYRFRLY